MKDENKCTECGGSGKSEYLKNAHDDEMETCTCLKCKGSGSGGGRMMTDEEEADYWADYW